MTDEMANLVQPIFDYGLQLKERLDQGEQPDIDVEQAKLKGLLLTEVEARRWVDFGGDGARGDDLDRSPSGERFLGVRYALVCWLDEFFILNSPWENQWNEQKLEGELYGTNDRAWKFWEQAELAMSRPKTDALEVFFLCVLLGFRGELRDESERLQQWIATVKNRIAKIKAQDWPYPLEFEPPTYVPPHYGREQLQTMVFSCGIVLLAVIPVIAFFLVRRFGE
jgi:type VI secretion system protein ImpK